MGQVPSRPSDAPAENTGGDVLNLLVQGFTKPELQLIDAVVRLSQRRQPRIGLVTAEDWADADIVLIDAANAEAKKWAAAQAWLQDKAVIWVDMPEAPGRTVVQRPVQWAALPTLLARVLEQTPASMRKQSMPAARVSAAESAAMPTSALSAAQPISSTVLVVDDSLAVRSLLRSLLESYGLQVTDVDNAETAIKVASTTPFACVLMDVLMPGIDGYEACRQIKATAIGNVPPAVVMLTSKSSSFDRIRGKMAGCDAYLTKPIDPDYLSEIVLRYIKKSTAAGGGASQQSAYLNYA